MKARQPPALSANKRGNEAMELLVELSTFIKVDVKSITEARRIAARKFRDSRRKHRTYFTTTHPADSHIEQGLVPLEEERQEIYFKKISK